MRRFVPEMVQELEEDEELRAATVAIE